MINSKQHGVQNSGPWDPWLPVVENSRLYAQRGYSARCAPIVPQKNDTLEMVSRVNTRPTCTHAAPKCNWLALAVTSTQAGGP